MTQHGVVRSLHDLGAAAWFGGSLMGAVGVNGAADAVRDDEERARVAAAGWAGWRPVSAAAVGAHLIGSAAMLCADRGPALRRSALNVETAAKLVVTSAAVGATAYSGALGAKTAQDDGHSVDGATEPSPSTPAGVAEAQ